MAGQQAYQHLEQMVNMALGVVVAGAQQKDLEGMPAHAEETVGFLAVAGEVAG